MAGVSPRRPKADRQVEGARRLNNFSERTEMLLPEPARALGALLGVPVPDLARGEGLHCSGIGPTCLPGPRKPILARTGTRYADHCPLSPD